MDRTPRGHTPGRHLERVSTTIQTLSPELLSEIFLYCLDDRDRHLTRTRMTSRAPLLLGRVCSRWRTISIATPDLWSSFTVGGYDVSPIVSQKDFEATALWITRSGSRPLTIDILYPQHRAYEAFLPQILDSIVAQSWRWKEIKMCIPVEFESILLAPFADRSLPHLVHFTSTILNPNPTMVHLFVLSSAPRLQHLQLSGDNIHIALGGQTHDIKNLHVTDVGIPLADLVSCLMHCPLLMDLVISVDSPPPITVPNELPAIIELPYLSHVTLSLSTEADPGVLFDRLLLPTLISLDLRMDVEGTGDRPSLKSMLARSRPPLEVPMLNGVPTFETTLTECISYTPALTNLVTTGVECTDITLHALTLDEFGTRGLCPLLERIDFDNAGDCSPNVMIEMILSRRTRPKSADITTRQGLKYLNLGLFELDTIRSNPHISECKKDGLRLSNY